MKEFGEFLAGHYEILKVIGESDMSVVYLVQDQHLLKQWAIKELKVKMGEEVELLKVFHHPALPYVIDVFFEEEKQFLVMEYIEGRTLSTMIEEDGVMAHSQVISIGCQLCDALTYLHTHEKKIIYRDMKPSNLIMTESGQIKLIDFGIARMYKESSIKDTVCLGTPGYAAPEQFGGAGQSDFRTDIYGVGMTLYYLLTGKNPNEPPYEMISIPASSSGYAEGLEKILRKCCEKNPEKRQKSAQELKYQLEHCWQYDKSIRRNKRRRISKFVACLLGGVVLFVLSGRLWSAAQWEEERKYQQLTQNVIGKEGRINCKKGIQLRPYREEGYFALLSLYFDEDKIISVKEKEDLEKIVVKYEKEFRQNPMFSKLCYFVGYRILFFYDQPERIRIKESYAWFNRAEKENKKNAQYNKNMTTVYKGIGYFYKYVSPLLAVGNGSQSSVRNFFKNLEGLMEERERLEKQKEPLMVKDRICQLICNSIRDLACEFIYAGIEKKEVLRVLNQLEKLDATGVERIKDARREVLSKWNMK